MCNRNVRPKCQIFSDDPIANSEQTLDSAAIFQALKS